ncbi:MAG: phosphoribosyl-AMP cyclohydrolase [Rhodoblastus sp.]
MAGEGFVEVDDKRELEEGGVFAPRFDAAGLIVCMSVDAATGAPLMLAYMNAQSLRLTMETGIAHYWSRSRNALWRKGDTSGQTQHVVEMRVDCDQDAILLRVNVDGDGGTCHTGRRSCFYRAVEPATGALRFIND